MGGDEASQGIQENLLSFWGMFSSSRWSYCGEEVIVFELTLVSLVFSRIGNSTRVSLCL